MPTNLRKVRSFAHLVRYLEDELGWPLEGCKMSEITFDYDPEDLGLKSSEAAKIRVPIRQLRPLTSNQPWGIFFIEFDRTRLPIAVLRRILSHLVIKKRASANRADGAAWASEDLLFISAFGAEDEDTREINFAHFHQEKGDLPTLRVLGWDGNDTNLKMEHVDHALRERLRWPDEMEGVESWRKRWSGAFKHRVGHVINTADLLAEELAALARRIRDAATTLIARESENGRLKKLHAAFKTHLIHDLTEEGFADTYAQTIAYGLLTAAISRESQRADGAKGALVADDMAAMVPVTNPFLKEMLETFLRVGGRKGSIDFDELGVQDVVELLRSDETDLPAVLRDFGNKTRGEDPVIHFYEHFLTAYNKQLKIQRGVFYTPQPVVSYIVRSVHELLQTEFGLSDGLADTTTWGKMLEKHPSLKLPLLTDEQGETRTISPDEMFVQILDPATGTATFPVEVIEVIFQHLKAKWAKGGLAAMPVLPGGKTGHCKQFTEYWNLYVPAALLPRLHAFELMMAPYAIAHMKIGLKLAETGYRFGTEERARIYLTNALEPKVSQLPQIGFDALAHEAAAVNEIKWYKRFTVVIGNPPYSSVSSNRIPWSDELIERFKTNVRREETQIQVLSDDYIRFIARGNHEIEKAGTGIMAFITNNNYFRGQVFRDMRQALLHQFTEVKILDLHGNSRLKEVAPDGQRDENVFDIVQGVGISVFIQVPRPTDGDGTVSRDDLWGSRATKYHRLTTSSLSNSSFKLLKSSPPLYQFSVEDEEIAAEYGQFIALPSLFGSGEFATDKTKNYGTGFKSQQDDFAIAFTKKEIVSNAEALLAANSESELRKAFSLCTTNQWSFPTARKELVRDNWPSFVTGCLYRPFDFRWTVFHRGIISNLRVETMTHLFKPGGLALCTMRGTRSKWDNHALISSRIVSKDAVSLLDMCFVFPITRVASEGSLLDQEGSRCSNLNNKLVLPWEKLLYSSRGIPVPGDIETLIIFYVYAILYSRGYQSRYNGQLQKDFPRLPLTGSLDLFRALARLGGELTALHLLESPTLDKPITEFIGGRSPVVEKIQWSEDTVWVDKAKTIGFKGVPEEVWNFHIGGYQVCEKWLKDRKGRALTKDDLAHYQKIVVALTETIRLMKEIDAVIETHGGWPRAFVTTGAPVAADAASPTKEEPAEGLGQDVEGELPLG